MSTTLDPLTLDSVHLESADGKKFLRRVVRESNKLSWSENWHAYASPSTDWQWTFRRTIKGELGAPEVNVEVRTDANVGQTGKTGMRQSFSDAKPVMVCTPRAVHLDGATAGLLAKMLLDGADFYIESSAGSTSSSEYGIATYNLCAQDRDCHFGNLYLGGETLTVNGRCVIRSAVSVD